MKNSLFILLAISFLSQFSLASNISQRCERIISLSPTITDTLLSLGLEDQIIAGTRYDRIPKDSHIQQVGGMFDPNYEAITLLSPSIVLTELPEDSLQRRKLSSLGFQTAFLDFTSLESIEKSLIELGSICGIEQLTLQKNNELQHAIATFKIDDSPKVLMLYAYDGDDHLNRLPERAAGLSFHQDILEAVGAQNAYQGKLNAPLMSAEGMLMMNPEIIVIIKGDQVKELDIERNIAVSKIQPAWKNLQSLSAIQNGKVFMMKGEPTFIASPDAVISTLKTLHSVLSD